MRWQDGLSVVGLAIGLLVLASLLVFAAQKLTRKKEVRPAGKVPPDLQAGP